MLMDMVWPFWHRNPWWCGDDRYFRPTQTAGWTAQRTATTRTNDGYVIDVAIPHDGDEEQVSCEVTPDGDVIRLTIPFLPKEDHQDEGDGREIPVTHNGEVE